MVNSRYLKLSSNQQTTEKKSKRLIYALGLFIYRLALDLVYVKCMATTFNYTGLTLDCSFGSIVQSFLLFFLCIPVIYKVTQTESFSSLILLDLILLSYIPFTSMVAYFGFEESFVIANTIYWFYLVLTVLFLPEKDIQFSLEQRKKKFILIGIVLFFAFTIVYISGKYMGFRFTVSMSSVYDMRDEARTLDLPEILKYTFAGSKAVFPVLLVYFLKNKMNVLALGIVLLQILSFSINGSKTVLFSTAVTIIVYYTYKEKYLKVLPWILAMLCLLGYLEMQLLHSININAYINHRIFYFPNQLGYNYYDFFTKNEPDYFRQGFLRWFGFSSPYTMETSHLIGDVYYSQPNMGANNGLISDAITNLGKAGIIIMPIITGSVLRLFDIVAKRIERKIYIVTAITYSFIILSSFLFTVLLTHGMIAVLFVFFLISDEQSINMERDYLSGLGTYLKH